MKKQVQSLWSLSALALFLSAGVALNAQQTPNTPPATQPPDAQAQQPANPDQTQPPTTTAPAPPPSASDMQTPTPRNSDQTGQATAGTAPDATQSGAVQNFSGTVVKSGDKFVLRDEASGKTFDLDHQEEVSKFESKRVRVKGMLDASGNMIHLQ